MKCPCLQSLTVSSIATLLTVLMQKNQPSLIQLLKVKTEDLEGLFECETPMEDVMEYVYVDDNLEVAEMLCDAEIASMVTGKDSGVVDDEQVDECDEEILKSTKPQLKSAIQLIQSHLLRSNNGNGHLAKLDQIKSFIDSIFLHEAKLNELHQISYNTLTCTFILQFL